MEDAKCLGWSFVLLLSAQATAMLSHWLWSLAAEGQGAPLSPTSKTAAAARLSKAARKLEVTPGSCRPSLAPCKTLRVPEHMWRPHSDCKAALTGLHA